MKAGKKMKRNIAESQLFYSFSFHNFLSFCASFMRLGDRRSAFVCGFARGSQLSCSLSGRKKV